MRMWNINPVVMCRQHLLGEHNELHMLKGSLEKNRKISGFLEKNLLEPQNLQARHDVIAEEMGRRGYNHKSPLLYDKKTIWGFVDPVQSVKELQNRCERCRENIRAFIQGSNELPHQ